MSHRTRSVGIALVALLALVAAACGQKPGVSEQAAPAGAFGAAPVTDAEGNIIDPTTGEVIGTTDDLTGTSAGPGGSTTVGGATSTGGPAGSTEGGQAATDASGAPAGGDATGVTNTTIKIGTHAPLTGAAPVPSDAVDKGKDLYFRWLDHNNKDIFGRLVEVLIKNDQYNPSSAVAICKEMVQKDRVFLLSGAAGTDQIQACARYAASVGVPYISAGVTMAGLTNLPQYFATSMSYHDQGPYMADYLTSKLGARGEKNGVIIYQTASFADARQGFLDGMKRYGARVHYDRQVPKSAGVSEARTVVQELSSAGIENVYVDVAPVWFLQVLSEAGRQGYNPQWVGPGITMTFDTVANIGCRNSSGFDGAKFFSPFPAYSETNRYDPNFRKALTTLTNEDEADSDRDNDFIWLGWYANRVFADMLDVVGRNLTRERFVYFVQRAKNLKNGIGPTLNYTPGDPFGADTVHVSEVSCNDGRWHTIQSFVKDF
ncbi:MAG: ABC transporter substrate-binding protein [Actinomycetota bacterium]